MALASFSASPFSAPTFSAPSSRPVAAPTRLRLPDLLHTTDHYANGVLDGRFDHLLPTGGLPADTRWYTRLHADDDLDVWLISWAPGHATELHDHQAITAAGLLPVLATAGSPGSPDLVDVRFYPESNLAAAIPPPRR